MGFIADGYNSFMDSDWGWVLPVNKAVHEAGLGVPGSSSARRGRENLGGKGGKGQQAAPPDFAGAAAQQTRDSRPNQTTPWGASTWSQGEDGSWSQQTSLNPQLQGLFNTAAQRQQQGLNLGALGAMPDASGARQQAFDNAYQSATSQLDPQFEQRENANRTRMANMGLSMGDTAYDQEMQNFGRERAGAYDAALRGANLHADQTANQYFSRGLAQRQQLLNEQQMQMNQPMQGLGSLLGMGLNMPGFMGPGNYVGAAQAQAGWDQNQQNMQNQQDASMFNAAGQLGAAVLSDARLKDEITYGDEEVIPGVQRATWRWKADGSPGEGVIAQDVERVRPDLVVRGNDGYLRVRTSIFTEGKR